MSEEKFPTFAANSISGGTFAAAYIASIVLQLTFKLVMELIKGCRKAFATANSILSFGPGDTSSRLQSKKVTKNGHRIAGVC